MKVKVEFELVGEECVDCLDFQPFVYRDNYFVLNTGETANKVVRSCKSLTMCEAVLRRFAKERSEE